MAETINPPFSSLGFSIPFRCFKLEKIQKEREAKQKKLLKDIYIKESEQEDALTSYPVEYERVEIK